MELAQLPPLEVTLAKYSWFYQTLFIPPSHIYCNVCPNQNSNKCPVDCCAGQNIPFVPLKHQKRLGKKPNELTEEILALCNAYFIPCPPEYRSSCKKDERETNWMCEIYSLWGRGRDLGSLCKVNLMVQVQKNTYAHLSQIVPIPLV